MPAYKLQLLLLSLWAYDSYAVKLKYKAKTNTIDKIHKLSQSGREGVGVLCCVVYKIRMFEGLGTAGLVDMEWEQFFPNKVASLSIVSE